jgi:hypothetical protein
MNKLFTLLKNIKKRINQNQPEKETKYFNQQNTKKSKQR